MILRDLGLIVYWAEVALLAGYTGLAYFRGWVPFRP